MKRVVDEPMQQQRLTPVARAGMVLSFTYLCTVAQVMTSMWSLRHSMSAASPLGWTGKSLWTETLTFWAPAACLLVAVVLWVARRLRARWPGLFVLLTLMLASFFLWAAYSVYQDRVAAWSTYLPLEILYCAADRAWLPIVICAPLLAALAARLCAHERSQQTG